MSAPRRLEAVGEIRRRLDLEAAGSEMLALVERLYPIPRSLTGNGVRETLRILVEDLPQSAWEIHEVPSGTQVLDWQVPDEWNVREAWIQGPSGEIVVDFRDSSLHLLGYSEPVEATLSLEELKARCFTLPEQPDLIPYRTSYYRRTWGFCLPHRQLESLPEGDYRVKIDANLEPGSLTYGEIFFPGETPEEALISCHVCHPALANDNLSGLAVGRTLARLLAEDAAPRRYGYRILFLPGTLGAITWLARNRETAGRIHHGLVAANLGDSGALNFKRSRRETTALDRAAALALRDRCEEGHPFRGEFHVEPFVPFGYDERQYGSPGFDLAVGSLTRTPWGRYPEYHTSADRPELLSAGALGDSLAAYLEVLAVLEGEAAYRSLNPHGEPQLGKRGLYRSIGGDDAGREKELALLWVLNQSDGEHSLMDIAERSGLAFAALRAAANALLDADLLEEV